MLKDKGKNFKIQNPEEICKVLQGEVIESEKCWLVRTTGGLCSSIQLEQNYCQRIRSAMALSTLVLIMSKTEDLIISLVMHYLPGENIVSGIQSESPISHILPIFLGFTSCN